MAPARPDSIALIGGHVALDLVNTVSWRPDPERWRENLAVPLDLVTWASRVPALDQHGITKWRCATTQDHQMAEGVLRRVHELREQLYQHLADCIDDRGADEQIRPGCPLHRAFVDAIMASSLGGIPAKWTLEAPTPLYLPRVLALSALELLQTMPRERLRRCDDDACGWLFLDTTRNHSRLWCSSGDCGNRHRARRHYKRTRASEP